MKKKSPSNFIIFISLIIFLSHVVTSDDQPEFEYDEKSGKGPSKWGDLKKEWETCKIGKIQSPIDLFPQKIKTQLYLNNIIDYKLPTKTILKNSGHDISLNWVLGEAGSLTINGTEFFLQQVHWHIPSEHTINGIKYDVEMHMVHKSTDIINKIAVLAILYKFGSPDPFLSQLMKMTNISTIISEKEIGILNPNNIITINNNNSNSRRIRLVHFYRYIGSLTTPPCTEGVIWNIMKNVRSVSFKQVEILIKAVQEFAKENARPIQPRNGRDIDFYI